jgi:nucleoside 2-deoxyribosyltransferase
MNEIANMVFLGCNYNDKKIKAQFDTLKKRIEKATPLSCVIVDKRSGKSAKDLWKEIRSLIEQCAACVFDLTGFRPNVVLELGYALSIKAEEQVFITFRNRKSKGKIPQWLLSDIVHLNRHQYIHIADLEEHVRDQLRQIPYGKSFESFNERCTRTSAPDKYEQKGLEILQSIRDSGAKSDRQVRQIMAGTACRFSKMTKMLKSEHLLHRGQGPHGKFSIPILSGT